MKDPLVSVVIPTFNRSEFLPETIGSVLAQTFNDYEIIVVDDGSTDNTDVALRPYMRKLRYFYKQNEGPSIARNFAIERARGRFIAFLDSDDIWLPEKLEAHVRLLTRLPNLGWTYSDRTTIDGDGTVLKTRQGWNYPSGRVFHRLILANYMLPSQVVVRKECFEAVGGFSEDPRCFVEDYDMWLRLAYGFDVGYVDLPLAKIRFHMGGRSRDVPSHYMGIIYAMEHIRQLCGEESSTLRKLILKRLFSCHCEHGGSFFYLGQYDRAAQAFSAALKMRPWSIRNWIYWVASCLGAEKVERLRTIKRRILRTRSCLSMQRPGRVQ